MSNIQLKKFDMSSIKPDKVIVLIGKRETGKSFFSADQEVKVSDINCENKNLIAVLVKANMIEYLIAGEGIETIVWINKNDLKQVAK